MAGDINPMLMGVLTGGGGVMARKENTSVLPVWRTSLVHIVGRNITALKALAPDTGAYLNEVRRWVTLPSVARLTMIKASLAEDNWKQTFWGSNYDRLSRIKQQVDPDHLFFVTPGVNADHWFVEGGRLCRQSTEDGVLGASQTGTKSNVPVGDNRNMAENGHYEMNYTGSWPPDQAAADRNADAALSKLSIMLELSESDRRGKTTVSLQPSFSAVSLSPSLTSLAPKLPNWSPGGSTLPASFTTIPVLRGCVSGNAPCLVV
jgi:hypothetical protein